MADRSNCAVVERRDAVDAVAQSQREVRALIQGRLRRVLTPRYADALLSSLARMAIDPNESARDRLACARFLIEQGANKLLDQTLAAEIEALREQLTRIESARTGGFDF